MSAFSRTIVAGVAVLASACGGAAGTAASAADLAAADLVVTTDAMRFVDPSTEVPSGTLTIGLDNLDGAPHDVTFVGEHGTVVSAGRGSAAIAEVTLEPGTYTVYCDVGGHRRAGMEFELQVG